MSDLLDHQRVVVVRDDAVVVTHVAALVHPLPVEGPAIPPRASLQRASVARLVGQVLGGGNEAEAKACIGRDGDINRDMRVDLNDLAGLLAVYNTSCPQRVSPRSCG